MRELVLTERTSHILSRIRAGEFPLSVYGRSHSRAMKMVSALVTQRLNRAGVIRPGTNLYRRAVHEMVGSFRTLTAEPLARALPLVVRKWTGFGLNPALLQELLSLCYDKFDSVGHQMPHPKARPLAGKPGPKPRRLPRSNYESALARGRIPKSRILTIQAQAEAHRQGLEANLDISRRLAALLKERGMPGHEFIRYNAFAQKVGRRTRTYSATTLARAVSDLVDLYEAQSLDRGTLLAISATLFGLTDLPA